MAVGGYKLIAFEKQELDDTISCCICTEFYTDPKALPCIHTFCMKCLQQNGLKTNKGPGDEMPCPICRQQFKIPQEGFTGLPNNFFIAKLIQVVNVSNPSAPSRALCDVCLEYNEDTGKEILNAYKFCTECKQKLCEECCRQHGKFKSNKNHKIMALNEQVRDDGEMANLPPSVCKLHEQKVIDRYCVDCKTVECAVCFTNSHRHHEGSHVSKFVDGFRKQIERNIEIINQFSFQTQKKKSELVKVKEDLQQKVKVIEFDVINRRDELKQFADSQENSLLQSLSSLRLSKLKEIQMESDDIDSHLSCLQSYSSYCQKMMAKGSASDICREVSDLSVKAAELQGRCQFLIERKIDAFKFCFTKSEFEELIEDDNLIGQIDEECNTKQRRTSTSKVVLIKKQSNEIYRLKEDINLERRKKETFRIENEQLKINVNNEREDNRMLKEELNKNAFSYSAEISQLKLDLDNEKMINKTFQANNEKRAQRLKQEQDCEKTLQVDISKLKKDFDTERTTAKKLEQELEKGKTINNILRANADKLSNELVCEKTSSRTLRVNADKLYKELESEKTTNRTLRVNADKLNKELEKVKTKYKTLQYDNKKLSQEWETQQTAMQDLMKGKEQENEDWETTSNGEGDLKPKKGNEAAERSTEIDLLRKESRELTEELGATETDEVLMEYIFDPVLVQTIRTKASAEEETKSIRGLTILDKELFVVNEESSEVEVYDSIKFSFSRQWTLKELIDPRDIGSCKRNKCLYIFDFRDNGMANEILRISPSGDLIKKWSTGDEWGWNLSVTDQSNVILTVFEKSELNEYSPDGQWIRGINLSSYAAIHHPLHAIKLTNGHYVVSHCSDGVCIVDANGKLKNSFGETSGSAIVQMKRPFYLCVDGNGFVMVADQLNSRVLLLDSNLVFMGEILSKEESHGLRDPQKILLDESNRRMFVADNEWNNERILIFDF